MNINLYYVPKSMRHLDRQSPEFLSNKLDAIQFAIHHYLIINNKILISNEPVGGKPAYLILALYNSALTMDDVKYQLDLIEYYGEKL